jgi:hypothetical protein
MLEPEEVTLAVELQQKTYGLLQWIADAVRKGTLTFGTAHGYATAADSMREWLATYSRQIPGKWRPRMSSADEVRQFTNLFISYLVTSFDLLEEPGLRAIPGNVDCYCEFCRRLVTASHLKARKVGSPEKARARALKQKYLEDLACELGKAVTESTARALIEGAETAEVVALSTYGASLVRRCQGDPGEPALLALWREFAWSTGSPRRDFRLSGEAILAAEQIVVEHLGA